jgi:2,4-dienoyl-CoA reductase-like NADH-dependent reductase (Old Yellow Enzyme family)
MKSWTILVVIVAAVAYWYSRQKNTVPLHTLRRWTTAPTKNDSLLSAQPITLPCGYTLTNRYIKAPMTEGLALVTGNPSIELYNLYETWSHSGCSLLITGNVMIHRDHLERSGNVIFDEQTDMEKAKTYARKCKAAGNACVVQLSHPGRQLNAIMRHLTEPVSASDVPLELLGLSIHPRALTLEEIQDIIKRFANSAKIAVDAGFDGVQIHGAHGYLLSQFLSPKTNKRTDKYGGSLENRSRLIKEVIEAVRAAVGSKKIVGIKLNSSDFGRGGFSHEESLQVIKDLHKQALIDFIEVSGGNYESMAIFGDKNDMSESTKEREGYFRVFAADASKALQEGDPKTKPVLALTGGIRTLSTVESILENNEADCVCIARPLAFEQTLAQDLIDGKVCGAVYVPFKIPEVPAILKGLIRILVPMSETAWYQMQMKNIANGKEPDFNISSVWAAIISNVQDLRHFIIRWLGQ